MIRTGKKITGKRESDNMMVWYGAIIVVTSTFLLEKSMFLFLQSIEIQFESIRFD